MLGRYEYDGDSKIHLAGEWDMANAWELAKALERFATGELLIDCFELEFIDSTGLSVLGDVHMRLLPTGGRIRLLGASGRLARVVQVIGFPEWIDP
jgi:anti-sigma B factor antagonist